MAVCGAGRQADQIAADDESLGAQLSRSIGEVDAVSIGKHPIRDNDRVTGRFEACNRRGGGLHRIHHVPFSG